MVAPRNASNYLKVLVGNEWNKEFYLTVGAWVTDNYNSVNKENANYYFLDKNTPVETNYMISR